MKTLSLKNFLFPIPAISTLLLMLPAPAFAQSPPTVSLPPPPPGSLVTSSASLPTQIIDLFLLPVVFILGFIAIYYMVLASIRLIISRGEPEKVAEARSRLIYAVVGFIVLLLAYVSLQFIETVFLKTKISLQ